MTGEKNRGVPLDKLWNLDDRQLATPKHDELVLSATATNIVNRFSKIIDALSDPENWRWNNDRKLITNVEAGRRALKTLCATPKQIVYLSEIRDSGELYFNVPYNDKPDLLYTYTRPGYPGGRVHNLINVPSGYTVSDEEVISATNTFKTDMEKWEIRQVEIEQQKLLETELLNRETDKQLRLSQSVVDAYKQFCDIVHESDASTLFEVLHEVPIVQSYNKFTIGFWDIVIQLSNDSYVIKIAGEKITTRYDGKVSPVFFIEAKPFIDSYGAVVRQINLYRQHLSAVVDSQYYYPILVCLYTPDTTFDEAFESQGITVIHP